MRKEFKMTDDQYRALIDSMKPVTYLIANGTEPLSPQENANNAWARLGAELGFRPMTVEPVREKSDRFFTAETT